MILSRRGTSGRNALAFFGWLAAASVVAPLPALASAPVEARQVKSALKSFDRDLRAFYKSRKYQPLWVRGSSLTPEGEQLAYRLVNAHLDGLDPEQYDAGAITASIRDARRGERAALARLEALLSQGLIEYAQDLHRPIDVGVVYFDEEMAPAGLSGEAILRQASRTRSLDSYLDSVFRMNPIYAQLRERLAAYRARWNWLPQVRIPSGPTLGSGDRGERVELLRTRLGLSPEGRYDAELVKTVREYQAAHGLNPDGRAGAATIGALNKGAAHHERLILANLERARALPASLGNRYILVDAAAQKLWMYEDGRPVDSMRVIVGKPDQQTPMMAGYVRSAILNPYWNVPPDLAQENIAQNVLDRGLSYLRERGYEVLSDWTPQARILDPKDVDWKAVAAGRQELRVRQLPGDDNMMGEMKFMMPNQHGIYLHDTPNKELFDYDKRQFSSGCVRVEDARRLSKWLFGKTLKPKPNDKEEHVALREPVPVYITYLTVAPTEGGIAFREDTYNRDQTLLARLERRETNFASRQAAISPYLRMEGGLGGSRR